MNIRAKIFGGREEPPVLATKQPKGAKTDLLQSISVTREESRRSNSRGEDRHRLVDQAARITHQGRSHDVQLLNLSGGGAMVVADFHPMLWDRVDLHFGDDGVIECAVRWLKDGHMGLEFAHETRLDCSPNEQSMLLRDVIRRSFPELEFDERTDDAAEEAADQPVDDDKRLERRHPLIWSGLLHHDYHSTPVRLRNISPSGALIEGESTLLVGAEPVLELGEAGTIFTVVKWVVGDRAGLEFKQPFDLTRLSRARPEVATQSAEQAEELRTDPSANSPWAPEWGRVSLAELREELDGYMKR